MRADLDQLRTASNRFERLRTAWKWAAASEELRPQISATQQTKTAKDDLSRSGGTEGEELARSRFKTAAPG